MALTEHLRGRRTGTTVAQIAERFGVSVRTIHRDLDALRAASLPIQGERGRGGGLSLDRSYTLPPVNFTAHEAAVLVAIGEWLGAARVMPFTETLQAGLDKVRGALSPVRQRAAHRLRASLQFTGVPTLTASAAVRSVVEAAWLADAPLIITYAKKGQGPGPQRRIHIRTLVLTHAETLLNCDDLDLGQPRQFALHRVKTAVPASAAAK